MAGPRPARFVAGNSGGGTGRAPGRQRPAPVQSPSENEYHPDPGPGLSGACALAAGPRDGGPVRTTQEKWK